MSLQQRFPGPFFDVAAMAANRKAIDISKYNTMQSYSGHGNNLIVVTQGKAGTALVRKAAPAYADGSSTLAIRGPGNPNPRYISNELCYQASPVANSSNLTDMVWAWGQFVDHELDLTPSQTGGGAETADITTPGDDPVLAGATISFARSIYVDGSDPRQQPNQISAYIDATNVYGSDCVRANLLRLNDGTGKLKTQMSTNSEVILPDNTDALDMAKLSTQALTDMLVAGDIRANENILLTSIHTLFVRKHNSLCDELVVTNPDWSGNDDKIFHEARMRVIAIMQSITYNEFLPKLIGNVIPAYTGYKQYADASIMNMFSTAAYRVGHTMLSANLLRKFNSAPDDTVALRDAFFDPDFIRTNGVDSLLYGAFSQVMQEIDIHVVEDVRSFLFGPPGGGMMLDLAALNIQRGRDHGLPDYNTCRAAVGLAKYTHFHQITTDTTLAAKLESVYGDINYIDPWVGGLCEDHVQGAQVGQFIQQVLKLQFTALRDGDRFWYQNDPRLSLDEKNSINNTKLSDVIRGNTDIDSVPSDVFQIYN